MECRACGTIEASGLPALTELLTGMSGNPGVPIRHHIIAFKAPTAPPGSNAIALRLLHELPAQGQASTPSRREFPAQGQANEPPGNLDGAGTAAGMAGGVGVPADGSANEATARAAAGGGLHGQDSNPGRWWVLQEGVPIRGKAAQDLAANVRQLSRVACQAVNPKAFWNSLGFTTAHELIRQGHTFYMFLADHAIEVQVVQILRVPKEGEAGPPTELVPGSLLVEATTQVPENAHIPATLAIGKLTELLSPHLDLKPS